jgi:hypothetical protein
MIYVIKMASRGVVHGPSSMKIVTGAQTILSSSLGNLRGCNVDNTDGRLLLCMPIKWAQAG